MTKKKKTKSEIILDIEGEQPDAELVPVKEILPANLALIPIDQRPLFPKMMAPVIIDDTHLKSLIVKILNGTKKHVGLILTKNNEAQDPSVAPTATDIHTIGTIAEIVQASDPEADDQPFQVMLGIIDRFRIIKIIQEKPYMIANVEYIEEIREADEEVIKAHSVSIINLMKDLIQLNPLFKEELNLFLGRSSLNDPGRLADFAASMTTATGEELQSVLEEPVLKKRMQQVIFFLKKEIDISRLQVKINKQIEEKISQQQRTFFLKEQLKEIKKELGISKEGKESEIEKFQERIEKLTLPAETSAIVKDELEKLGMLDPSSPEFNVSRTYLDWLTILPWGVYSKDSYDIKKAERILNKDHYGLDDVKERILEFLSVGKMKGSITGSIICFVGPPGVGKTSIGQSIAESIGREFYRFSVGGMRDEAEIKGHRRTYIGALPGKFLQALKVCKTSNPVLMLDEIDKIGTSFRGDPASALLEVLDPEQNKSFLDHYLDVPFDLSNVLFICTANQLDTIPRPLLDRMEVIRLSGYILEEKKKIATKYLIPKQRKLHGLEKKKVEISSDALTSIIDGYAREPGVRGLEQHIKKIMRKSAKEFLVSKKRIIKVEPKNVETYLGKPFFTDESKVEHPPGVILGLAWTSMGGDTLFIEASGVKSQKSGFKQTGQLGDVMVESSEIAYSFLRSFMDDEVSQAYFNTHAIHLHVPAGATPKDGPSAGITMACAIYSLIKNQAIKPRFAMTGELSLKGKVMPIGGVKEKTIAAKRAKVTNLIFPEENRNDFEELPKHIKRGIKVNFVSKFSDVLKIAFKK